MLHCAAIKTGQFDGMRPLEVFTTINRWHRERGFSGFGYHGFFMPDGSYYPGRPYNVQGAHCRDKGKNHGTLGFLLIESKRITRIGEFADYFTPQQAAALGAKLASIDGLEIVSGHNDYAAKLCPGFRVTTSDWLAQHQHQGELVSP